MGKTCNGCGDTTATIPLASHELAMDRAERKEKRLIWLIALLIVLLVGTNIGWLIYESQFETFEETQTSENYEVWQEAEGNANSVINGGVING